jgi:hypothetical protein
VARLDKLAKKLQASLVGERGENANCGIGFHIFNNIETLVQRKYSSGGKDCAAAADNFT